MADHHPHHVPAVGDGDRRRPTGCSAPGHPTTSEGLNTDPARRGNTDAGAARIRQPAAGQRGPCGVPSATAGRRRSAPRRASRRARRASAGSRKSAAASLERKAADEQAHREADPAQHADAEQLAPARAAGIGASRKRIISHDAPNTPTALPTTRPSTMPSGTLAPGSTSRHRRQRDAGIREREQRQHDERDPRVQRVLGGSSGERRRARSRSGIASAVTTPASVAWTPDFSTQTQSTRPTTTYGAEARDAARGSAANSTTTPTQPPRAEHRQRQVVGVEQRDHDDRAEVVDDRDRRQEDFSDAGTREPSSSRMPSANAMSVAIGIAPAAQRDRVGRLSTA